MGQKIHADWAQFKKDVNGIRRYFFDRKNKHIVDDIDKFIEISQEKSKNAKVRSLKLSKLFESILEKLNYEERLWVLTRLRQKRYDEDRVRISISNELAEELDKISIFFGDNRSRADTIEELVNCYKKENSIV